MIFNHKEGFSLFPKPGDLAESTAVPVVYPSLRGQVRKESKSRIVLQYIVPKDETSISVLLPLQVAKDLGSKIQTCYLWRDQALEEHEDEIFSFLVMFRYMDTVELKETGFVNQFVDLGIDKGGHFCMRLAKSEVGSLNTDYTSFLQVSFQDDIEFLLRLGRQIEFVCSLIEDAEC